MPWRERGPSLWPAMTAAFDSLHAEHELVVLEGAGSPAEINLPDLVNNRMVAHADAAALLVADIDRGGAFAHLYGTWSLVPDATRERLAGFVLNRFRGDADAAGARSGAADRADRAWRAPASCRCCATSCPTRRGRRCAPTPARVRSRVAVLRFPYGSNLDELHLLARAARVALRRAPGRPRRRRPRRPARFQARRRRPGVDAGSAASTEPCSPRSAARILGICGGCQMLGRAIDDPDGVEGGRPGRVDGLGLLPFDTVLAGEKVTAHRDVTFPADLPDAVGRAARRDGVGLRDPQSAARPVAGPVWASGGVLATTVHGLLEDPDVVERLVGRRPRLVLDETFDLLADAVDAHLDTDLLRRLTS